MWFRRKPLEAHLDKELRYHFDRMVREFIAEGMDSEEARRRARLEFGGMEQLKEECRDVRGRWLEDFGKDLRYAARTLRRSPGFLAVSVLSLALGIGANTAIFSLINAVMLRSLSVEDPERLVQISRLRSPGKPGVVSYPLFEYFRDNLKSVSMAAAQMGSNPAIVMDGAEEMVNVDIVSGAHYSMLGMEPVAGRLLDAADDAISPEAPAAVISYRYWQRRFGLNPAAIGKTFTLQNKVFTIIGVTPARYTGTRPGRDPDITVPLLMMLSDNDRHEATSNFLTMLARLAPGATVEQANAELQVIWQGFLKRLAAAEPEKERAKVLSQLAAVTSAATGFNPLRDDFSEPLLMLMGMVAMLLLLGCGNLSGMLFARAASRQREITIRLAIGAGGGRLLRQFLTESLLLAVLGGGAGLLVAQWFSNVLVAMLENGGTLQLSTAPDWRVLTFTSVTSLAACLFAGLAPGVHMLRANLNPGLKQSRTTGTQRIGKILVMAQISISMVLVVGGTLFVDTVLKLYTVDLGVRTDGVVAVNVRSSENYPQARSWAVQEALLSRLRILPGVASASAGFVIPIGGGLWTRNVQVEGYTFRPEESESVGFNAVAPHYFGTIGTPLLGGREFDERDTNIANKVAIVNESFARYFFNGRSPLGRRVTSVNVTYEIVGVVKNAKYQNLRQDVLKTMYIPWTQREGEQPTRYSYLVRMTDGDAKPPVEVLERLVRETDAGLRLRMAQTYSTIVDRSIVRERMMATLGGFFGLLALIVAGMGIFGVMAFQVSRRINEIGLRMALGASRGSILGMVMREVWMMLAAGCAVGGLAALTVTGLTQTMLFGTTPTDPVVFVTAALVLGAAAFIAGWLPARRASRVDPMVALRHE